MSLNRQDLLAWGITSPIAVADGGQYIVKPASGATITLWQAPGASTPLSPGAVKYKRLITGLYVSHDSAASGLQFDVSVDATNWRNLISYSVVAATLDVRYVAIAAPFARVRYVNSANTLTTWEMWVIGDEYERGTQ